MTPNVFTITEEVSLYEMIKMMYDQHIHTFPVVRDGKMVGVAGRRDVMNACYITACCI
jgi:CBS domain-containing protein